jgi:hypothetical protein
MSSTHNTKGLECPGTEFCGKHEILWKEIKYCDLDPSVIKTICCTLIRLAAEQCTVENKATCPIEETRISCNGEIRYLAWEPFEMVVFNDPIPLNSLDGTLGSVCHEMISNTRRRNDTLTYGKHASKLVLSRKDVSNAFRDLRGKTVDEVCRCIVSIRVQPFLDEAREWHELEKNNSFGNIWSQRKKIKWT